MRINWMSQRFNRFDGYGRYGQYMIRALLKQGVEVYPALAELTTLPGWMQRQMGLDFGKITVMLMPAHQLPKVPGRVWGYTMIESDRPPKGWVKHITEVCERLIVPCEHNADAFKNAGVSIPIHVVYGGTEPQDFPMLPDTRIDRPYTFVCLGDRGMRKGVERAWCAFFQAFENVSDVRLVIKTRAEGLPGVSNLSFKDKRVSFWKEDTNSMAEIFEFADCFVFPSYAEGWGMPPREAAMMGLPVIATRYSGLTVGLDQWAYPLENYLMGAAHPGALGIDLDGAQWAIPDVDELASRMRWCYDHWAEARAFGKQASKWLRDNQTWDHSAKQMISLVEQYG